MASHTLAGADRSPEKVALEVLAAPGEVAESWTYADLRAAILGTAGGLAALGIGQGDRVLLRLGNSANFPIAFFAANAIGAVPVPSSAQLTAGEFDAIRADLDPALVILGLPADLPPGTRTLDLDGLRELRGRPPAAFAETAPDDPAYMVYTSGTSGRPKGVVHGQRAAWARRMMWDGWYGLTSQDRVLHAGAINWTFTLGVGLTDPWAAGATALVYAGPPDRHVWPRLAAAHRPTIFAASPGVYRQMLDSPDLATGLAALRHGLSAGEGLPPSVRAAWEGATGRPIYEALGMSEISTYVSFAPGVPTVPGRAGRPQPGRRIAVLPEAGDDPVPIGSDGILAVSRRDPGLMIGYWRRPEETAAAFRGEWFVTGDRARMETDGTITHLGRTDDLINAGGFRVSPAEIEAALLSHPGVAEAAVIERAIAPGVTVIAAFYVPTGDAMPEATLAEHCAGRLARYKCPRAFTVVAALPRDRNGKLLRRQLREVPA
jgi:acyl-coenzyme A synthetase/AMP-(fatty) acid ligase